MAGQVHGVSFSVRVGGRQAREFDDLAHRAGLKRSELLRLLVGRVAKGDLPRGLIDAGVDLNYARQVQG